MYFIELLDINYFLTTDTKSFLTIFHYINLKQCKWKKKNEKILYALVLFAKIANFIFYFTERVKISLLISSELIILYSR